MSKESIVKELFWNIVEISEPFRPSGEEYEEARKKRGSRSKIDSYSSRGRSEDFRRIHGSRWRCRGLRRRGNL